MKCLSILLVLVMQAATSAYASTPEVIDSSQLQVLAAVASLAVAAALVRPSVEKLILVLADTLYVDELVVIWCVHFNHFLHPVFRIGKA